MISPGSRGEPGLEFLDRHGEGRLDLRLVEDVGDGRRQPEVRVGALTGVDSRGASRLCLLDCLRYEWIPRSGKWRAEEVERIGFTLFLTCYDFTVSKTAM